MKRWSMRSRAFARTRSAFAESTLAELAWQRTRNAAARWARWGVVLGALVGLVLFAPAAWLARAVASATGDRLLLTDARGTVWSGSALPVLTGGPDSRDAAALPGRLAWDLAWRGLGFELRARQACCLNGDIVLQLRPGLGRFRTIVLPPAGGVVGQWPAAWLAGLGTPWNTLQLGGTLRLSTTGLTLEWVQGRLRVNGVAEVDITSASSRLSTLPALGSYRVTVQGNPTTGDATISLVTLDGALQLSGGGQWAGGRMRFRGEARAAAESEAALANLLNIIGRRQGALAVISIG